LLHARGGEESFRAAAGLLDSADPDQRSLGADILGQLGAARDVPVQQRPFAGPGAEALIARIDEEKDPRVLRSMGSAFGHVRGSSERIVARGA